MTDTSETWKTIPGFQNYSVSNLGRVRRNAAAQGAIAGKILKVHKLNTRYMYVWLYHNNKCTRKTVHRLVTLAFLGKSTLEVNHINGIRDDNRLANLEYCSRSQNMKHAFESGLFRPARGTAQAFSKLTETDVLNIRKSEDSQKSIAKLYNVNPATISKIIHRKLWAWLA